MDDDFTKIITPILPKLYISGAKAANAPSYLVDNGIRVVLTIMTSNPVFKNRKLICYHNIKISEASSEDLLIILPEALKIISNAINSGLSILVHCRYGRSQSPVVVIAYLMKFQNMSLMDALSVVSKKRQNIKIGNNFISQLKLFESLKCDLNVYTRESMIYFLYRWYELSSLSGFYIDKWIEYCDFFYEIKKDDTTHSKYCCKYCNTELFGAEDIISLENKNGEEVFCIFPTQWICRICAGQTKYRGDLKCPTCKNKVGDINWKEIKVCQRIYKNKSNVFEGWYAPMVFSIESEKVNEVKARKEVRFADESGQDSKAKKRLSSDEFVEPENRKKMRTGDWIEMSELKHALDMIEENVQVIEQPTEIMKRKATEELYVENTKKLRNETETQEIQKEEELEKKYPIDNNS